MKNSAMARAFTVIELLVVITIIVVLLALLTPALDRAIEMATRAECGAKLHAQGMAMHQYGFDARFKYVTPPHNGHWLDGAMTTVGEADAFVPGFKAPGGQLLLYHEGYLPGKRDLFYCGSNEGTFVSAETHWFAEDTDDDDRYQKTYIHFPYIAGGRRPNGDTDWDGSGKPDVAERAADHMRSPSTSVMIFENIMAFEATNHRGGGSSQKDLYGDSYEDAPAGGNVLQNDGSAHWRNFAETRWLYMHPTPRIWWL